MSFLQRLCGILWLCCFLTLIGTVLLHGPAWLLMASGIGAYLPLFARAAFGK